MKIWTLSRFETENHLASWLQKADEKKVGIILIADDRETLHDLPDEILFDERIEFLPLFFKDDDTSFTEGHARKVLEFIESIRPELLVVSCQAGRSRSPAIALAVDERINRRKESPFWKFSSTLNRRVLTVMREVLGGK